MKIIFFHIYKNENEFSLGNLLTLIHICSLCYDVFQIIELLYLLFLYSFPRASLFLVYIFYIPLFFDLMIGPHIYKYLTRFSDDQSGCWIFIITTSVCITSYIFTAASFTGDLLAFHVVLLFYFSYFSDFLFYFEIFFTDFNIHLRCCQNSFFKIFIIHWLFTWPFNFWY